MNLSMYPPQIEGKIPAFAVITGEDTLITVPYELNKAISLNDFTHMCIMIKTVTTGTIKFTAETSECKLYNNILKSYYATFTIPTSNLFQPTAGNYYKIQIAFKNNITAEESAWSNVSVIKCTKQPTINIDSLTPAIDNINPDIFVGSYINYDTTEKLYSYNFTIYDTDNNIYETSGNLIHNSSTDEVIAGIGVKSIMRWAPTKSLKEDIRYRIALSITTINDYQGAAGPYIIRAASTVDARIPAKLLAKPDYDNGCVHLSLVKLNSLTTEVPFSGRFVISRYDVQANLWREVCRFNMLSQTPSDIGEIWTDYTIEHGVNYLYALQAYNNNKLYSNRMIHVIASPGGYLEYDEFGSPYYITSDFEDMFLTDGERQLRIRYNPKVSSYKTTLLESKMETMGSKYPFIFRNGNVGYKEFPISGLLSYLADEKDLFMTGINPPENKFMRSHTSTLSRPETYKEWVLASDAGAKLTSENFYRERQFKTSVLDWLNNGKPKLFRSPSEGSYIVQLMNVTLSPNEQLGRMLHTFNAQAYEIAPYDFDYLKEFNLLSIPEIDNRVMKFRNIKLSEAMNVDLYSPGHEMYAVSISNASPGTKYTFSFAGLPASSSATYVVGITGTLSLDADVAPVASIVKNSGDIHNTAVLHYGYYDTSIPDNFSHITNITMSDAMAQIIGYDETKNIITDKLQDIRREVGTIYSIIIKPRHITKIYSKAGEYYRDSMFITKITQGWDETEIYFVTNENIFYSGNPHNNIKLGHQMPKQYFKINNLYIIDLSTGNAFLSSDPMKNTLNTNPLAAKHFVQLTQGSYYVTGDFETIHSIHMSPGVYIELAYAQKEIEYSVENTEDDVKAAKAEWLAAQAAYIASASAEDYAFMNAKYNTYINVLEEAVANAQMEVQNYVL